MDAGSGEDRLRRMHAEFSHLAPIFRGAADRALCMFLPDDAPVRLAEAASVSLQWRSRTLRTEATLDLFKHRITYQASSPV